MDLGRIVLAILGVFLVVCWFLHLLGGEVTRGSIILLVGAIVLYKLKQYFDRRREQESHLTK